MRRTLNKSNQRRLEIIEFLNQQIHPVSSQDIAEELDLVLRTVQNDIKIINDTMDILQIAHVKDQLVLQFSQNNTIDSVYDYYMEHEIQNLITPLIFTHPEISYSELEQELHVSATSLHRAIQAANKVAKERFQVYIDPKTLEFVGNEVNIRFFIAQHYYERFHIKEWPFEFYVSEEDWGKFLAPFYELTDIDMDFTRITDIKISAFVSFFRYINGHTVTEQFTYHTDEIWELVTSNDELIRHIRDYSNILAYELDRETLTEMFFPYLKADFAYTYQQLTEKAQQYPQVKFKVDHVTQSIDSLANTYNLQVYNREELILEFYSMLVLENIEPNSNYIFKDHKKDFSKKVKDLNVEFYESVKDCMGNLIQITNDSESSTFLNHMIYTLYTHWNHLIPQLIIKRPTVKILVISKFDLWHANTIRDLINFNFQGMVEATSYYDKYLNLDRINHSDFDLIVASSQLPSGIETDFIYIDIYPSQQNFKKLSNIIFETHEKKLSDYNKKS